MHNHLGWLGIMSGLVGGLLICCFVLDLLSFFNPQLSRIRKGKSHLLIQFMSPQPAGMVLRGMI